MVYDAARRHVLLFGGVIRTTDSVTLPNDLWAWDGQSWRMLPVPNGTPRPLGRDAPHLAYDAARERVVLLGGRREEPGKEPQILSDVWEWDGLRWYEIKADGLGMVLHSATWYDPSRRRVGLYFRGFTGAQRRFLEWDGARFTVRDTTGAPVMTSLGAFATPSGQMTMVVLQAGRSEDTLPTLTWKWNGGTSWTRGELGPTVSNLTAAAGTPAPPASRE